ncbi:hypothetical protein HK100_009274 [Physocladia obscura]|uniref:DUF7918 domain-containing protein n=1 Tax=Physocladia obscura TaxID=109957 RepID=A0AAD5XF71_9FUNG|nr:hypothetical protein HK100_009274 [Physocladia obscura]
MILTLPSNHPNFRGAIVTIAVLIDGEDGSSLEYCPLEELTEPSPDITVVYNRYIESKIGKDYKILIDVRNPSSNDALNTFAPGTLHLSSEVYVDGVLARKGFHSNGRSLILGRQFGNFISRFSFVTPSVVTNGGLTGTSIESIGTVVIKLWIEVLQGECETIDEYNSMQSSEPPAINEKAKKGVFLSSATKYHKPEKHASRTVQSIRLSDKPLLKLVFHCNTREFLDLEILPKMTNRTGGESSTDTVGTKRKRGIPNSSKPKAQDESGFQRESNDDVIFQGIVSAKKVVEIIDLTGD